MFKGTKLSCCELEFVMLRDLGVRLFIPFIHFVYRCFMSWLTIVLFRIGRTTCAECSSTWNSRCCCLSQKWSCRTAGGHAPYVQMDGVTASLQLRERRWWRNAWAVACWSLGWMVDGLNNRVKSGFVLPKYGILGIRPGWSLSRFHLSPAGSRPVTRPAPDFFPEKRERTGLIQKTGRVGTGFYPSVFNTTWRSERRPGSSSPEATRAGRAPRHEGTMMPALYWLVCEIRIQCGSI
jgi:hypothetical protein